MDKKLKVTLLGSVVNLLLPPLKLVTGIITHSSALIADAIHSLSDLASDLVLYVFLRFSNKPKDSNHDYGHGKYETLATLLLSLMLSGVGILIAMNALGVILRYLREGVLPPSPHPLALYIALLSIVAKEALFQITSRVAKETHSAALQANAWHHRSDAYSSMATLLGIGGAILVGGVGVLLEPIAAAVVAVFIIWVAIRIGLPAIQALTEADLGQELEEEILQSVSLIPGVEDPHNLKTRHLGNAYAIEMDIRVRPDMRVDQAHDITLEVEKRLRGLYGECTHIVIHVEPSKKEASAPHTLS